MKFLWPIEMNCRYCNNVCIKKGKQSGCQKLYCKSCGKYQQAIYIRKVFNETKQKILEFLHGEGNSISTISRFLRFSKTTICRWIEKLGSSYIHQPDLQDNRTYEADELKTYVGKKENWSWIMYSIEKLSGKITSFCVGRRTKENLEQVTEKLVEQKPKSICTDGLPMYKSLIPEEVHEIRKVKTNKIERRNLQLRLQMKRLNRKTICFSKSERMLRSSFLLYLKYSITGSKSYEFVL